MKTACKTFGLVGSAIVVAGFVFTSSPTFAAPNGYTQIPIAKVFGNGVAAFSFADSRLGYSSAVETTQYGLFNQFEVGLDYQSSPAYQRTLLGNAKYLIAHNPGHLPDIAVGMTNIARHQRADPYLVATTQPGALGFSLGVTRPTAGGFVGMGGVAYNLNPNVQLVADYVDGPSAYSTYGVIAAVTKTISVNVAYARPNAGGGIAGAGVSGTPEGFVVNISYVFHALHGRNGGDSGGPKNSTAGGATGN